MTDSILKSQMLRVPSVLIEAVKELSRLHRQGHTRRVLSQLQQLIADVDSSSASDDVSSAIFSDSSVDIKQMIAEMISSQIAPIQTELAEVKDAVGKC